MNPLAKKLLLAFLDDVREQQACASCNDFDLSRFIPDPVKRRKFILEIGDSYTDRNDTIVSDSSVLEWVIQKVKEA